MKEETLNDLETTQRWAKDVFLFANDVLKMLPSEPLDELKGRKIPYTDTFGNKREAVLFDEDGNLVFSDLSFYTKKMFKNQSKVDFKAYKGTRFTWQQTVSLEAYNRAINTFGKDSYDLTARWLSIRSGHGTGKTGTISVIAIHFLWCFFGAQIGMTANTDQQVNDIFMKEFFIWSNKMPKDMSSFLKQTDDHIRVDDSKDWFLRAQVARPDKPEALAGLHGKYVLLLVDEASGIAEKVFEVMHGALTGDNYIVIYTSNPTRTEGEFFNSHKAGSPFTKLHFSSEDSPIVKDGYCERWAEQYGMESDEYKIRVKGEFPSTTEMDDKGWIPLFANVRINFEPERGQIINGAILGVDPAGAGKDHATVMARDNIYLKMVLREQTSSPKDGARKVETIRDAYNCTSGDIGIDGFGEGAKWIANINTKVGESVTPILADDTREESKDRFSSYKAELAWAFREWCLSGGIIITNKKADWLKEMEKIKYKRDGKGRIMLQPKVIFKKENGFSPDRFDGAIYTFFKANPSKPPVITKAEKEDIEILKFLEKVRAKSNSTDDNYSSMQ